MQIEKNGQKRTVGSEAGAAVYLSQGWSLVVESAAPTAPASTPEPKKAKKDE